MIRSNTPIERNLRPTVEWYVVFICFTALYFTFFFYNYLFMNREISIGISVIFFLVGALYFNEALELDRYKRNIKKLRFYSIDSTKTTQTPRFIRLGKGFLWTSMHTQRLLDTFRVENNEYVQESKGYLWARSFSNDFYSTPILRIVVAFLNSQSWFNPFKPMPDIGGNPRIHGVEPNEVNVDWSFEERVGHTVIFGTTRVGKTRLEEILVDADIQAGAINVRDHDNTGNVVVVMDPKGDGELFRRCVVAAMRAGRLDDFYMFHLGFPDISVRYNPIGEFQSITEVAGRTTNTLSDGGNSQAFKDFSWRFVNIVARASHAIGEKPTYAKVSYYMDNLHDILEKYLDKKLAGTDDGWKEDVLSIEGTIDERRATNAGRSKYAIALTEYAAGLEDLSNDSVLLGLMGAINYQRSYYEKLVSSLMPFLEKMTSEAMSSLLSPEYFDASDHRKILKWEDVINRRGIVYIGLDAMSNQTLASAVSSAMLSDLLSCIGSIYKKGSGFGMPSFDGTGGYKPIQISLHLDEFNELITGDEMIQLLNKAGGAGVMVHAYTQTLKDIEAKIGDQAKAAQMSGNFQNIIMMRVKDLSTAEFLTKQLPMVEVNNLTDVAGTSDSGTISFRVNNEDRLTTKEVPLLDPSTIMALPKGQAFHYKNGSHLYKVRFPLIDTSNEPQVPDNVDGIVSAMKEKYQTSENWGSLGNG